MCAILGILGKINQGDHHQAIEMLGIMNHRAPDGLFIKKYQDAILGHGRLAVIDLNERSNQPLSTPDERFTVVFNGAIYNYLELKQELSSKYEFKGESDTEVLLAGYKIWGNEVVERLRGMFAFCIYDNLERQAFLARDRFGQKPLFFTSVNGQFIFASEVKALLKFGVIAKPNYHAIYDYLENAEYDHDERTFFDGISQLRPGECATWTLGNPLLIERYYKLSEHIVGHKLDYQEAVSKTRSLMFDTCNVHMRCDVPVGVSLSGGLDSSALLTCLSQAKTGDGNFPGFFADFGDDYSEESWARSAAEANGSDFYQTSFLSSELEAWIKPLIWHLEGPSGGIMNFALTKLMGVAGRAGIIVLQDGTGIDEACGGYKIHHLQYLSDLKIAKDPRFASALLDCASHWNMPTSEVQKMVERLLSQKNDIARMAIDGTAMVEEGMLASGFINKYSNQETDVDRPDGVRESFCHFLQSSKVPRNNRMKDRTSMAFGLELRTPFLDHVFIETTLSLPVEYLFYGGVAKSLVRDALSEYLDPFVAFAKKRSVHSPQALWLQSGPISSFVENLINSESFANRGIFNVESVKRSFTNFKKNGAENSFFVWQWVNVEMWFRTFIDDDYALNPKNQNILKQWY